MFFFSLAGIYSSQKEYEKAEKYYQDSLEIDKIEYGDNHISLASTLSNLATLYNHQKKYDKAEKIYLESLEIRKNNLLKNHLETASTYSNLGDLYFKCHKYIEAFQYDYLALKILLELEMSISNKYYINDWIAGIKKYLLKLPKNKKIKINKKIEELNNLLKQRGFKKLKLKKL